MKEQIVEILEKTLGDKMYISVNERTAFNGSKSLSIAFAVSDININNVKGQKPQLVSLRLDLETMELQSQIYGGMGGRSIYRNPDKNHPKEKYLAMVGVKIPFRKPKKDEKSVLRAIENFAKRYVITLKDNLDTLRYKDIVNYNEIIL